MISRNIIEYRIENKVNDVIYAGGRLSTGRVIQTTLGFIGNETADKAKHLGPLGWWGVRTNNSTM